MVCAMSSASRLRVKVAPNARQPASGDYFASTTRLHTKLTCLEWHNINGRKADTSLHVLEALALFSTRGATELRVGLPVKLNVHKLDEESIQSVLRFLDDKGVLGGLVGQDFPQVVHRLIEAGRHYRSAPELLLSRTDLTGVSDQAQDNALVAANLNDEVLHFSQGCRSFFRGCEESLALTAELVLLVGPRETHALRTADDSRYRQFFSDVYDFMYVVDPSIATPRAAIRAFAVRFRQLSMPELARIYAFEDTECAQELMRKMTYFRGTAPQREDEVASSLEHFVFKLDNVSALTRCLGASSTWASKLRQIGNHVASSARHGGLLDLLHELEDQLTTRREFIDYAFSADMAEHKVIAKLCSVTKGVDVERRLSEESSEHTDPKVGRAAGSTGLVVNPEDMQKVLSDSFFLKAASKFDAIDSPAGRAKYANEESRVNAQFDLFSGKGLLLIWQRLLRHAKLRSHHTFLNSLTPLATDTVLCRRVGFCQVVNAQGKRKGFSATYSWPQELHAHFVAGRHTDIGWYKGGYCVALMAIRKAEKVDEALGDFDFLTDGDHFFGVKDFMHRTTLGYGYAAKPSEGTSVAAFFDLLAEVRSLVLEAPQEQQAPLLELLIGFFRAANAESGPYLLQQLDQVSPQGKRLEGWLPPASESGGVMHQMREALSGQLEIDDWRKKVPHLFVGSPRVVGRFSAALGDSPPTLVKPAGGDTELDPDGGGKAVKRRKIGGQKSKVKFLDEEHTYAEMGKSVYGDFMDLAAELGIDFDKRCWPVMVSRKSLDARCEFCPFPDLHLTRTTGMHKPVTLPRDFSKRYQHAKTDFRLPAKRKALASSAAPGPQ